MLPSSNFPRNGIRMEIRKTPISWIVNATMCKIVNHGGLLPLNHVDSLERKHANVNQNHAG